MSEQRRLAVLRAIVEDYVATREPVGSKALVDRHALGVSPATIRNDMAVLEEEGLIAQPHTSAGRVPTDKGYRAFVDGLSAVRPLSPAERRAIERLLGDAADLDDVLERTVRALAQLTQQVAVVQYPSLARERVRHVELVPLAPRRLVLVLITDTGRVEQRLVDLPADAGTDLVTELRGRLNAAAAGRQPDAAASALAGLAAQVHPGDAAVAASVVAAVRAALATTREDRVVLAGRANLLREGGGFAASLAPVLEAIEEQVVLLRLLSEMADDPAGGVSVRIGREIVHTGLSDAAVVSTGYSSGAAPGGEVVARLGILGPTRMDYPTTIAAVRAVARYLSKVLAR